MKATQPLEVKYFIASLSSNPALLKEAQDMCEQEIDVIDYQSKSFPFDVTDYYVKEMGQGIERRFFSFETPMNPGKLAEFKITCNRIEEILAIKGNRQVNLDIGYLDYDKVVLASAKYNGQKIYLAQGIYADPTLTFSRGTLHPHPWAFPDFKKQDYYPTLLEIRQIYKVQMKRG